MKREFFLILPIGSCDLGDVYPKGAPLPLHCTLMHWFEFKDESGYREMFKDLESFVDDEFRDIELVSKGPALFGPNNDVSVHVLERTDALHILHNRVFSVLAKLDALPQELRWIGAGWNPHVTDCDRVFSPGERHTPNELILVERIDGGDKTIRARWYPEARR